jgi:hypothetical protein
MAIDCPPRRGAGATSRTGPAPASDGKLSARN